MIETPELRYPTQLRIDFSDPEMQRSLYDLFDLLRWVPDMDRLNQEVSRIIAKGREMDDVIWEKDVTISEQSTETKDLDEQVTKLRAKVNKLQKKLEEAGVSETWELKKKAERLQRRETVLEEEKATLQQEVVELKSLVTELDW